MRTLHCYFSVKFAAHVNHFGSTQTGTLEVLKLFTDNVENFNAKGSNNLAPLYLAVWTDGIRNFVQTLNLEFPN